MTYVTTIFGTHTDPAVCLKTGHICAVGTLSNCSLDNSTTLLSQLLLQPNPYNNTNSGPSMGALHEYPYYSMTPTSFHSHCRSLGWLFAKKLLSMIVYFSTFLLVLPHHGHPYSDTISLNYFAQILSI